MRYALPAGNPMRVVLLCVLLFEVVVFGLAVPVMILVSGVAPTAAALGGGGAALLALVASGLMRKPIGYLVGWAAAGCDPSRMGIGPVPAVEKVLRRASLSFSQMDLIELNEAFACQALACVKGWGSSLDELEDRINVNGSGISLGHPVGATGAIIATKAIHELHRTGGRYALATMCIGGGQGIAAIFERV